jgi:hypothetical protein
VRHQLVVDPAQVENGRDLAYQVIAGHHRIEIERIEQLALVLIAPAHHGSSPPQFTLSGWNHCSSPAATDFCNKIGPKATSQLNIAMPGIEGKTAVQRTCS